MEKIITDSKQLGVLRLLDDFARANGLSLADQAVQPKLLDALSRKVREHQANSALLHGFRTQTMFAYLAAALGGCKIITEEDSGDLYLASPDFKRPDYRILTHAGQEFFVEVKNFHPTSSDKLFTLKSVYANTLRNYAQAFTKPLLIAIYWAPWALWTLIPLDALSPSGKFLRISLPAAATSDQKSLLGDCLIGIPKPFALRFYSDPARPRAVAPDGQARFTIKRAAFVAAGRDVTDPFEERLAWFFFRYGRWEDLVQSAHVEDGQLIYIELQGIREDPNPGQEFLMIGQLSEMVSRQFNDLTVEGGKISHLTPDINPDQLGAVIPRDFKGDVLGLWRFTQQPEQPVFPPPCSREH